MQNVASDGRFVVLHLSQSNWLSRLKQAIQNGSSVLFENVGEELNALNPIISRAIQKKGRSYYLNFGGEKLEYDSNFRLVLQTRRF